MTKKVFAMACVVLTAGMVLLSSCKKESSGLVELNAKLEKYGGVDSKVYMDYATLTPMWNAGDLVNINGTNYAMTEGGTSAVVISGVPETTSYSAVYPAEAVVNPISVGSDSATIKLESIQEYVEDASGNQMIAFPMVAFSETTTLSFKNVCALVKVEVNNPGSNPILVNAITLKASGNAGLTGQHRVSLVTTKDTLTDSITNTTDYVHLNCKKKEVAAGATHTFYVVTWAFSNISLTAEVYTTDKSTYCQYKSTKTSNGTVSLSGNELGRLPINAATSGTVLNKWGTGNGFIVAPSNVFYNGTNYYLTNNQLEYYNAEYSSTMTNPCDKFCWGGGVSAHSTPSATSNFEDIGGQINTPSQGYWSTPNEGNSQYFYHYYGGAGCSYKVSRVKIGTSSSYQSGAIILPVVWDEIGGFDVSGLDKTTLITNAPLYTLNQWAILESRGACFLPAISEYGNGIGDYWTSTPHPTMQNSVWTFYWKGDAIHFTKEKRGSSNKLPVRLIHVL